MTLAGSGLIRGEEAEEKLKDQSNKTFYYMRE
jgi:hypothetical protein